MGAGIAELGEIVGKKVKHAEKDNILRAGKRGMSLDIEKKIEFVSQAYRNTQDMISFADPKTNISFSIQSLLISIGLGTSILANNRLGLK